MKIVKIPGGTATLREKADMRKRHQRIVEAAAIVAAPALAQIERIGGEALGKRVSELRLSAHEATSVFDLQDATIVAVLDSWTLPEPLPTLDTLGDLTPKLYDALAEATSKLGAEVINSDNFEPSDPTAPGFTETPTTPSADSEPGLRDDKESESITVQLSTGTSTDIEPSSED